MLNDVIAATPLPNYQLQVTFDDGVTGIVDLAKLITFTGVFEPLQDPLVFNQVFVNPDLGTVTWPSGADLDPIVLYCTVTGRSLPLAAGVE